MSGTLAAVICYGLLMWAVGVVVGILVTREG
jgi:hypothetical protein